MTGVRNRIDAFITWGWDYFSQARGPQVLDRSEAARIDWEEDASPEPGYGLAVTPFALTHGRPRAHPVRDDVALPLPLRPADARAGAARRDHADALAPQGDEAWLRLTRFFGTLMLINFAIGVATGLVQEFQFGMNWSVYSEFVGDVFGAPLAIEGLAAFMLEATFLGLWIFGWDRLSPRVHLATIWLVALGTWLSAFFIIVANSWMQHPVGYELTRRPRRADRHLGAALATVRAARVPARVLVGLTDRRRWSSSASRAGTSLRGRNVELFRQAAMLALIVAVPISALNLAVGSRFGDRRRPTTSR